MVLSNPEAHCPHNYRDAYSEKVLHLRQQRAYLAAETECLICEKRDDLGLVVGVKLFGTVAHIGDLNVRGVSRSQRPRDGTPRRLSFFACASRYNDRLSLGHS